MCAEGHCALVPLVSPCDGVAWRRTSLLPAVREGELLAVVGREPGLLRGEESRLLTAQCAVVEGELAQLAAQATRNGAARELLAHDEQRSRVWLAEGCCCQGRKPP